MLRKAHARGRSVVQQILFSSIRNREKKLCHNYAKPAKNSTDKTPRSRWREDIFLSPAFSLCTSVELKVMVRHAPSTSEPCETHAQAVEKSITGLVLRPY